MRRPARLEQAGFGPATHLAPLIRTRQVTAVEITRMDLDRLVRHDGTINCTVTITESRALAEAAAMWISGQPPLFPAE